MRPAWLAHADSRSPWPQVHVVVAGIGVSGFAAADGLLHFGARVTILDELVDDLTSDRGKLLEVLGGSVRLGPGSTANLPDDADLVIVTGWPALRCWSRLPRAVCPSGAKWSWPGDSVGQTRSFRGSGSPVPTARPRPPRCWSRSWPQQD